VRESASESKGTRVALTGNAREDRRPRPPRRVADRVQTGQQGAIATVNQELVATCWAIEAEILACQDAAGGVRVIDRRSHDLRKRLFDARELSPRNFKCVSSFAAAWPDEAVVQARLAQLPWYHYIALLEKLGTTELGLWHRAAAIHNGWGPDILVQHIDGQLHERSGPAITNFARTLPPADADLAQQETRDRYVFGSLARTWRPPTTSCGTPTTSRPSACCCARPRTTSSPSTRCGYTAPIGVAEWKTAITAHLPAERQSNLQTIEELEAELADEDGEPT
jgi:DUF1016 N-terminal domain